LTLFATGLGHLYAGQAKRGFFFYFIGQGILVAAALPLIYYFPVVPVLLLLLLIVTAFFLYCLQDAVLLAKQAGTGYVLKKYNKWYVYLGCWALSAFVIQAGIKAAIQNLIIQPYKISSGSLEPTILRGDHILAKKLLAVEKGITRSDIVMFPFPEDTSNDYIKRVVALGGETIEIKDKKVFIDGDLLEEPYVMHTDQEILPEEVSQRDNFGPMTVPDNAVFVLGDNRDHSLDSRYWGVIKETSIQGKPNTVYWSWDGENSRVRWSRIGKKLE
jgi:signal peptidase I